MCLFLMTQPITWTWNQFLRLMITFEKHTSKEATKIRIIVFFFCQYKLTQPVKDGKSGVIDRIGETYDDFLDNAEVQEKVKELWAD